MTTQSLSSGYIAKNFGSIINSALSGVATIVERYSQPLAVIISHKEYQHLKSLEAALWAESRRIAEKNDREGTWVSGDEMDRLMVEWGVFTAEELEIQDA